MIICNIIPDDLSPGMRALLFFAYVVGTFVALYFIARFIGWMKLRSATRTIENWRGKGVNEYLSPIEVSLLKGEHPANFISHMLFKIVNEDKGAVPSLEPPTLIIDGKPSDDLERAFFATLDSEGHISKDKIYDFIEKLYAQVNRKMRGFAGAATVRHYNLLVDGLWGEYYETGNLDVDKIPWLALKDENEGFENTREDETGKAVRMLYFGSMVLKAELFGVEELGKRASTAKAGFFLYRRDLTIVWKDLEQIKADIETRKKIAELDFRIRPFIPKR